MPQALDSARFAEAAEVCAQLTEWLLDHALPLWWKLGADHVRGGFHESLRVDGSATEDPRRARLHPRQIYAYSVAAQMSWNGPVDTIVRHGVSYFLQHYSRPDWLFRTLVAADGRPIDDSAVLYDQSFALLGLAAAYDELDDLELRDRARELESELHRQLQHPLAGFEESALHTQPLLSNSHMHLLESALAWMDLDHQLRWQQLAGGIVELALSRFVDAAGFVREFFARDWTPAAGEAGRIVEPGHQFEWAWLLLRWADRSGDRRCRDTGLRLIDLAETHGVDRKRGVAINSIRDDGLVLDAAARLWPQTERIKAACIAAEATQDSQRLVAATEAARALLKYLDTPVKGLWHDLMKADGSFADTLVPASSLYHIVVAIAELRHTLARMS
jgi:mannose-6-phosphate isomerase